MPKTPYPNIVRPGQVTARGGWAAVFSSPRPINLEIGIGGGEFLHELAKRNPDENYVGIDVAGHFLKKAAKKAVREDLTNVLFSIVKAKQLLVETFPTESIEAVYINFPDPWPKKSHEKRRHFDEFFMTLMEDRLVPGGYLYLATDVPEYAEEAYAALTESSMLSNAYDKPWVNRREWTDIKTRYERKWAEMGKTNYYLAFTKSRPVEEPRLQVKVVSWRPLDLGDTPLEDVITALQKKTVQDAPYLMKTLACKPDGDRLRMKAILVEKTQGFEDYLHAEIYRENDHTYFTLPDPKVIVVTESKVRAIQRLLELALTGG